MTQIKQIFKFAAVLFLIVSFLFLSTLINFLPISEFKKQKIRTRLLSRYARFVLFSMRVKVHLIGELDLSKAQLVVSNHLSYIDVMVLSAIIPSRFVTSVEMGSAPGLGILTKVGGCLFVERRNRARLNKEIEMIAENIKQGMNVVVFPEATSTNGEAVLRFKRPLFKASALAGCPVQPVCLNYRAINKKPLDRSNRDSVFWYGDMDFLPHLFNLMALDSVEVDLALLPALPSQDKDVDSLSSSSYELISERFIPCTV